MYVYVFYMFLVNIIGEMLFQFCLIEFYKEGKYDLDFKNPNSDPSKWVRLHQNLFCLKQGQN